jgi:uncharacterized membrane protein
MAVGLGVGLLVLGLILVTGAVDVDVAGVQEGTVGWILVFVGILAIVVSVVVVRQRRTTETRVDRRVE